ncbi:MAG: hypothetical protein ACRENU_03650 [Gemmatimonadaceae bacterium]
MRLLLALFIVGLSGCRFWYRPVPVANAVGEEKTVLAGDTVHVYRENRFEVYGPSPEAVYDGYEQLSRSYRAFQRYFGTSTAKLAFVLFRDSVEHLDPETLRGFRNRGFIVVEYARPRSVRSRRRYSAIEYGGVGWPIAPSAARAMLLRFAETEAQAQRADPVLLERFPAWYRAAVVHLVGEAEAFASDLEFVREKRQHWWAFRELLTLVRPAAGDSLLDPTRRPEADEQLRIFAAQSSTLGRYLVEREGPTVLARLGREYVAGRGLNAMLGDFRNAPRTIPELEQRWKNWIETQEN